MEDLSIENASELWYENLQSLLHTQADIRYDLGIILSPLFKRDSENLPAPFYTTLVVVSIMKKVVFDC